MSLGLSRMLHIRSTSFLTLSLPLFSFYREENVSKYFPPATQKVASKCWEQIHSNIATAIEVRGTATAIEVRGTATAIEVRGTATAIEVHSMCAV